MLKMPLGSVGVGRCVRMRHSPKHQNALDGKRDFCRSARATWLPIAELTGCDSLSRLMLYQTMIRWYNVYPR